MQRGRKGVVSEVVRISELRDCVRERGRGDKIRGR